MAEVIHMTIVLRKIVSSIDEAKTLVTAVKSRLADQPDISLSASIGISLDQPEQKPT